MSATISAVHDLARLLPHGVITRNELALVTSATSVARWTATGELLHVHPGVVMLPDRTGDPAARARAATLWVKGPLSHLSALWAWELSPAADPVHVTVSADRYPRNVAGVAVHRTTLPVRVASARALPVTHLPRSLVDAWAWAHAAKRNPAADRERPLVRQAVITALRGRGASALALRTESVACPRHPGRAELSELLDLVTSSCESELEIWGVQHVLPGPPRLPQWVQQYPVRLVTGRSVRLDASYPDALVAVELDGAAFHGSREARERDLRRDSALAALGWIVLRFSYTRLTTDPEGCRREIIEVVRRRMAQR